MMRAYAMMQRVDGKCGMHDGGVRVARGEGGVGDRERKRVHHPTRPTGTGVVV